MASQGPLIGSVWLAVGTRKDKKKIPNGGSQSQSELVAGGRFELPTFGL